LLEQGLGINFSEARQIFVAIPGGIANIACLTRTEMGVRATGSALKFKVERTVLVKKLIAFTLVAFTLAITSIGCGGGSTTGVSKPATGGTATGK
jgi:hypothetical protein